MPNDKMHQLTYLGALIYIIGVFLPLISIPVVGDVSYYRIDNMSAIITVILAGAAPALIYLQRAKLTAVAAIGVWVVLLWPALKNIGGGGDKGDSGLLGDLMDAASDPLQELAGNLFSNIGDFSIGGYIFLIGLLVLTVGGVMTTINARK